MSKMWSYLMIQEVRTLYGFTMEGLEMEQLIEGIMNLVVIDIISITIFISSVLHVVSFKKLFDISAKHEKLD